MGIKQFINDNLPQIKRLNNKIEQATWSAYTEGDDKSYNDMERFELEQTNYFSDPEKFKELKRLKRKGIKTPLLARQLDKMYKYFLEDQLPKNIREEIVKISNKTDKIFNTTKSKVDGKTYSRNDVHDLMKTSDDSILREKVWKAHKNIGRIVAPDVLKLVRLRNKSAELLGFPEYRTMQLYLNEHNPEFLDDLFKKLDNKTRKMYGEYKSDVDDILSKRFKISKKELRPWHYKDPFMQEPPKLTDLDPDSFFKGKNILDIARNFYSSAGFDIKPILANSSLYPKELKSEHAYCFNLDRDKNDLRILCNLDNTEYWLSTLLHELGHAIYEYEFDELPWLLKRPAHMLTTEGVAEMFGYMTKNHAWLQNVAGVDVDKYQLDRETTLQSLVFVRWSLVMYNFEKELYTNPAQDLNSKWWDIVEKYQMVPRPENRDSPDWATKDHIVQSPIYYQDYILGQCFAAQLVEKLAEMQGCSNEEVIFYNQPELSDYLKKEVFAPGATIPWTEFVKKTTGKTLSVDAWVNRLVQ